MKDIEKDVTIDRGEWLLKMAETCQQTAEEALEDREYEEALALYDDALTYRPDFLPALIGRAELYLDFDEPDLAEKDIKTIQRLYPDSVEGLMLLGNLYRSRDNLKKALDLYNQVIGKDPDYSVAFYSRAITWDLLGKEEQALADFNTCLKLTPDFVSAWYDRGVLYACQKKWDAAVDDYSKAIELDPEFVQAYINRGDVYSLNGNRKNAELDFQKAIELDPENGMAYYYRGLLFQKSGDKARAKLDFQTAREKGFEPDQADDSNE